MKKRFVVLFLTVFTCFAAQAESADGLGQVVDAPIQKIKTPEYVIKAQKIIESCSKGALSSNPVSDKDIAQASDKASICIKKELMKQIDVLFGKNEEAKKSFIDALDQAEQNVFVVYNIASNENKYCDDYFGCGTINKYLVPASKKRVFLENVLEFVISIQNNYL